MALRTVAMGAAFGLALLAASAAPAADGDNDPIPPFQIGENVWWVGASDIASYLIKTPAGMILIDGGYDKTAPQILANLKTLGVDPKQVKILLSTHGHYDHAGGLAQVKAATGAQFYASAPEKPLLEAGGKGDFFFGNTGNRYQPVKVDKVLADNEKVTLGGVTLTARVTPGHTKGCTSWTFPVKVDGQVRQALVICSLTVLPGYKLVGNTLYPKIAQDYAATHARLQALPCEVFLGSHGVFFGMQRKRAALKPGVPSPFVDPAGCKAFLTGAEAAYRAELAKQQAAAKN